MVADYCLHYLETTANLSGTVFPDFRVPSTLFLALHAIPYKVSWNKASQHPLYQLFLVLSL